MEESALKNWINASLRNDQQAFRQIVEHFQPMIYSIVFRILCNEEDAKDIVQETFIKVWKNLQSYKPDKKFATWIYSIAVHLSYDKLKSAKHSFVAFDKIQYELAVPDNIEQKLIDSELGNIIALLTNDLSPKQKVVFTLRYIEEMEIDEIVQITCLSSNKIKSNLFLARKIIRDKLKQLYDGK